MNGRNRRELRALVFGSDMVAAITENKVNQKHRNTLQNIIKKVIWLRKIVIKQHFGIKNPHFQVMKMPKSILKNF